MHVNCCSNYINKITMIIINSIIRLRTVTIAYVSFLDLSPHQCVEDGTVIIDNNYSNYYHYLTYVTVWLVLFLLQLLLYIPSSTEQKRTQIRVKTYAVVTTRKWI